MNYNYQQKRHIFFGFWPVFIKELKNLTRNPWAIYFSVVVTITHLLLIGYGVNTKVRQIDTTIYDLSLSQTSRKFIQQLINTDDFRIIEIVDSDEKLDRKSVV